MYGPSDLSHDLISEEPHPLFMGEMPFSYEDVPARVAVNASSMMPAHSPGKVVLSLPMIDVEDSAMLPDRGVVERFLDAAHAFAQHEPTYWHCQAGLNRSGLLVAAYLHRHRGTPIEAAIARIRERRSPMALSNTLFDRTLREWYGAENAAPTPTRGWRLFGFGRKA